MLHAEVVATQKGERKENAGLKEEKREKERGSEEENSLGRVHAKARGKRVGKSPLQLQSGQISGAETNGERTKRSARKRDREREREKAKRARVQASEKERERRDEGRVA